MANDAIEVLQHLRVDDYLDRFLSGHCPLIAAARVALESKRDDELTRLIIGDDWQRFVSACDGRYSRYGGPANSLGLTARRDLVLAALGHDTQKNLRTSVELYSRSIDYQQCPQLEPFNSEGSLEQTALLGWLQSINESVASEFQSLASEFGWLNPAVLATAAGYVDIHRSERREPDHSVETPLLFAIGDDGGAVGWLTLERFNSKLDYGGGACYADPQSMAYVHSQSCFQSALQQAWWREIGLQRDSCNFDIRWSLRMEGDDQLQLYNQARTSLLRPLSGPSAGVAFACAFRALRLGERLDRQIAITADFASHFDESNSGIAPVGGVPDKTFRNDVERAGIEQVITSSADGYFSEHNIEPNDDGDLIAQLRKGKLDLIGLGRFDRVYRRVSDHARITDAVKKHLAARAANLLEKTCEPYVPSSLSRRRPGNPQLDEPAEVIEPLSDQAVEQLLTGKSEQRRTRILAESGLGKSTLLIKAEHLIAAEPGAIVPIRVGAGPKSASKDYHQQFVRLPLLSDFDWSKERDALLSDIAERLLGDIPGIPDSAARDEWICKAAHRGEIVWLMDSVDQTRGELSLAVFSERDGIRDCPILLSARPETRETKRESYEVIEWDQRTVWVDPFDERRIRDFWKGTDGVEELLKNDDWEALRKVPILLMKMKRLGQEGKLQDLPNREAVYDATLRMLLKAKLQDRNSSTLRRLLAEIAWEIILGESTQRDDTTQQNFTGAISGDEYSEFADQHRHKLDELEELDFASRQAYLDEFGYSQEELAWRHFSFCEWFAGLHLAKLPPNEQTCILADHAMDERWAWIIRFACCAAARDKKWESLGCLVGGLLRNNPFLLWKVIRDDNVDLSKHQPSAETLCRWLVHRDWDGATAGANADPRPAVDDFTLKILTGVFKMESENPVAARDTRLVHPAWELVLDGCVSDVETVSTECQHIRDQFLGEFESLVRAAAARNQHRRRNHWNAADRAVLELVPDENLAELGVLSQEDLESIRRWPTDGKSQRDNRERFHDQLQRVGANYCLCPPVGWQHPHGDAVLPYRCDVTGPGDESIQGHVLPNDFLMQRSMTTNLQYEVFDPRHRRDTFDGRVEEADLGDHPVVNVSSFQAEMFCTWITGNGTFGRVSLPNERDWESCCRSGHDRPGEEFGIPWCDQNGAVILDENGQEQFDSLSSWGANFNGNYPAGDADKGPYKRATVPVGQFRPNEFGLDDMHGQTREWQDGDEGPRCVRGGVWYNDARYCRASYRDFSDAYYRGHIIGFRVTRTT